MDSSNPELATSGKAQQTRDRGRSHGRSSRPPLDRVKAVASSTQHPIARTCLPIGNTVAGPSGKTVTEPPRSRKPSHGRTTSLDPEVAKAQSPFVGQCS